MKIIPYVNQNKVYELLNTNQFPKTIKTLCIFLFQRNPYDVFKFENKQTFIISNKTKKEDYEILFDNHEFISYRLYTNDIFCFMAENYDDFIEYISLV